MGSVFGVSLEGYDHDMPCGFEGFPRLLTFFFNFDVDMSRSRGVFCKIFISVHKHVASDEQLRHTRHNRNSFPVLWK